MQGHGVVQSASGLRLVTSMPALKPYFRALFRSSLAPDLELLPQVLSAMKLELDQQGVDIGELLSAPLLDWKMGDEVPPQAEKETLLSMSIMAPIATNEPVARLLLQHGAHPGKPDGRPMRYAICHKQMEVVRVMLEHGADVHISDASGSTALHDAAHSLSTDSMRLLLAAGAGPNKQAANGDTPLHILARPFAQSRPGVLPGFFVSLNAEERSAACGFACRMLFAHGADAC